MARNAHWIILYVLLVLLYVRGQEEGLHGLRGRGLRGCGLHGRGLREAHGPSWFVQS